MTLKEAAPRMGLKPRTLGKMLAERAKPAKERRYSAALHEHYMTRHFVKDTKGHKKVGRGRFEWHIEDARVLRFERARNLALSGRDDVRRSTVSIDAQLKDLGL